MKKRNENKKKSKAVKKSSIFNVKTVVKAIAGSIVIAFLFTLFAVVISAGVTTTRENATPALLEFK